MRGGFEVLRKVLAILPVVRANQGIRVAELARLTGIPEREIAVDLPRIVNYVGVPPYSPADLVDLSIEGDRVWVRFAEQFRRPARLTLREALALDMALAGLEEEREGPFARAAGGIREKVRAALGPEVAREMTKAAGRIAGVRGPGRAADRIALVRDALARQRAIRVEYFSRSSGRLVPREIHPYGIFERAGHYYVVARSDPPGKVVTLRADRIRSAALAPTEYEIPEDFDVSAWRRAAPPAPEGPAIAVRIRFAPEQARFARELFPGAEAFEVESGDGGDGGLVAIVRTRSLHWLVSELLRWGDAAVVESPPEAVEALVAAARAAREAYGRQE